VAQRFTAAIQALIKSIGFSRRGALRLTFQRREIFQTSLRKVLNTGELLVLVCWHSSQSLLK
jgi:hypothetical protein